jgi:hypothetical protein
MDMEEQKQKLSKILINIADSLDIPESKYEEAVSRYKTIGEWLDADDSKLHIYHPIIYPQGSFMLGTMVKPINDGDEYDIDLVCHLEIDKNKITKSDLKDTVGDRLKENETYKKMIKERKRCWTLNYANEFHMDILPAIPDCEKLNGCILITDKKLMQWQKSNPKGYAQWFANRMRVIFQQQKVALAESIRANIEDIPDYKVRTPLQRSIQILKRHRDISFNGNDSKPISIIITTLAAQVYQNEADLFKALMNIIKGMTDTKNLNNKLGKYYIPNPTNIEENFAEKWNDDKNLPKAFFAWLKQLKSDMESLIEQRDSLEIKESLSQIFGAAVVGKAFAKMDLKPIKSKTYPEVKISKPDKPWARQREINND